MIAIHKFLLVVAAPSAIDGIDVVKSLEELLRVAAQEVAIMAICDGMLVGTMGLMKVRWWYNGKQFLTDRWHFCLPQFYHGPVNDKLMDEALAIADLSGLRFLHNGKVREGKGGVLRLSRHLYTPESMKLAVGG